jgi:hypothetical protein
MSRANPIKRPGKFEGETYIAKYLYEHSEFLDEDMGSVDELGWYGRFSGKLKGRGPFHVIISENSQGFVGGEFFATERELMRAWSGIEQEYERFWENEEPEE